MAYVHIGTAFSVCVRVCLETEME